MNITEYLSTQSGLIPICAWCKSIRNNKGNWNQVEFHVIEHLETSFTHGICPECMEKEIQSVENRN